MSQESIRQLFSATQHEMAMLLGISRGQYAMYESGKRNLPPAAQKILAQMLSHTASQKKTAKKPTKAQVQRQQDHRRQQLQRLQQENAYQLQKTEREIASATKRQEASANRKLLVNFLDRTANQNTSAEGKARLISAQSSRTRYQDAEDELVALEVRREVLVFEGKVLTNKLDAMSGIS